MIFKALLLLPLRWRCSSDCVMSYVTHSCLENWDKFWLKLNMLLMMIQTKAQPVSMSLDWVFCSWVWAVTGAISHESNEATLGKERQADKSPKTWGFYLLLDSPPWAGPALRIIGPFGCWDLPYFRIEASLLFLSVFLFSYNLNQSKAQWCSSRKSSPDSHLVFCSTGFLCRLWHAKGGVLWLPLPLAFLWGSCSLGTDWTSLKNGMRPWERGEATRDCSNLSPAEIKSWEGEKGGVCSTWDVSPNVPGFTNKSILKCCQASFRVRWKVAVLHQKCVSPLSPLLAPESSLRTK